MNEKDIHNLIAFKGTEETIKILNNELNKAIKRIEALEAINERILSAYDTIEVKNDQT